MPKKSRKPTFKQFNGILQQMAGLVLSTVESELKKKKWRLAFIDARAPVEGGSCISKLRVILTDGSIIRTMDAPAQVNFRFLEVLDIKDQLFPDRWYGFKLTIFPDGKCETEFNYNANCVNDPDFYDVDEDLKK